MSRDGDGIGDIDFDTAATWERSSMRRAKQVLNGAGIAYERRGRGWLRIKLCEHAALYFAPGTGSLRFEKGKIFSSRGMALMLAIVRSYQ
jgi:hypothetical protein